MKKIIGIFSIVFGVAAIFNVVKEPSIGMIALIPLLVLTGVFLITFDSVYKKSYIDGFYARNTQNVIMTVLTIVWVVLWAVVLIGWIGLSFNRAFASMGEYILVFLLVLIVFVPGLTVIRLFDLYSKPYCICKKYILTDNETAKVYLGDDNAFIAYSNNDFVFASDKALFFKKSFCLLPFAQIESVENKKTIDGSTVIIKLKNGKKIKMLTKQFNDIATAMNANSNVM